MFRKKYKVVLKVVVLAIVLGVLLNACSKRQTVTEEYNTISDLAYSEKCKIEPIIYIEEKTGFVPYIVFTKSVHGSCPYLSMAVYQAAVYLVIGQRIGQCIVMHIVFPYLFFRMKFEQSFSLCGKPEISFCILVYVYGHSI